MHLFKIKDTSIEEDITFYLKELQDAGHVRDESSGSCGQIIFSREFIDSVCK